MSASIQPHTISLMIALSAGLLQQPIIAAENPATQPAPATQSSSEQRSSALLSLVEQGKWDAAQTYAQEWAASDAKAAIPLFVIDVAVQVRGEEGKLRRGQYDFP